MFCIYLYLMEEFILQEKTNTTESLILIVSKIRSIVYLVIQLVPTSELEKEKMRLGDQLT